MKKIWKYPLGALLGAAYAALPAALSRLLIRQLDVLFSRIGALASLDEKTLSYGAQILSQLKSASILSPWLPFLLTGAALGLMIAWLIARKPVKHIVIHLTLWLLLLIPLTLLALWLTTVNDIALGNLLQSILPILPHIL